MKLSSKKLGGARRKGRPFYNLRPTPTPSLQPWLS
jgi:hypothetical protein